MPCLTWIYPLLNTVKKPADKDLHCVSIQPVISWFDKMNHGTKLNCTYFLYELNSSCNVSHNSFTTSFIETILQIKSIQEHLHQLLQTVSPSKMLAISLCLDVLFRHFNQSTNQVQDANQKVTLHRPNSISKAVDGLFKYNGNRVQYSLMR